MNATEAITIAQGAILIALTVSAPVLLIAMVIGLFISLFQAITQIQEMTLTFVPKIFAVMLTLLFAASWMVTKLVDFTHNLITSIPNYIR